MPKASLPSRLISRRVAACVKAAERLSREQCPAAGPVADSVLDELGRTLAAFF